MSLYDLVARYGLLKTHINFLIALAIFVMLFFVGSRMMLDKSYDKAVEGKIAAMKCDKKTGKCIAAIVYTIDDKKHVGVASLPPCHYVGQKLPVYYCSRTKKVTITDPRVIPASGLMAVSAGFCVLLCGGVIMKVSRQSKPASAGIGTVSAVSDTYNVFQGVL